MKKIISMTLAMVLMMGIASAAYGAEYKDMKSTNWAYESVKAMSDKEIIKGYPDGSFKPSNRVTYGEFIKMVVVAVTGKELDVTWKPKHWSENYYHKAIEIGCFNEHQIKNYQLDLPIPRGDMALIISSALGDIKMESYSEIQGKIKDVTYQTRHEYDITKSYYTGVLTGYTDGTFKPGQTLSRAESASVIHRLVDESKRLPVGKEKEGQGELKRVRDIVKNADSFRNPGDGSIDEDLANAETYEIIKNASVYRMSLRSNRGTNWIQIDNPAGLHQIFFMKDGYIVASSPTGYNDTGRVAIYDCDITKIDYVVSFHVDEKHMDLIVNPFKK